MAQEQITAIPRERARIYDTESQPASAVVRTERAPARDDAMELAEVPVVTREAPTAPIGFRAPIGWRTVVRWALVAGALAAVAAILWMAGSALTPFIIGLVLAYLMVPLVDRLDRRMPRWAAILVVYALTFGVLGVALAYIIPAAVTQINEVIDSIPEWYENGREEAEALFNRFQSEAPEQVRQRVDEQIAEIQRTAEENATNYARGVATFLFSSVRRIFQTLTFLLGFLIIPFFLFYVLIDTNRMPEAINRMLHPRIRDDFWNILRIVDTIFGKYIRGQLILGVIIAVVSFVGLQVLNLLGYNVRFTLLLALVAGVGELIPVVGPILSAIPAIIVGATESFNTALFVTVLYILIQQLENQILVPRIVGNTLKLHAALLMALLVVAGAIGGLPLVILVAPLTAIARDIFLYLHQRLQEPPVPPAPAIQHVLVGEGAEE